MSQIEFRDGSSIRHVYSASGERIRTEMGGTPQFHYYTRDYLGNNRAVVNGNTGEVEQTIAYYPFGGVIADLGFGHARQQRKFGGKELTTANGLNEYDFLARQYWPIVPMFTSIDPMCEKYYWLSPYLYCGNDPVNSIDPEGKEWKITFERDDENKLHINMNLTGVIYNNTPHKIDMKKLAGEIARQLNETFSFSGENVSVTMNADIRLSNFYRKELLLP